MVVHNPLKITIPMVSPNSSMKEARAVAETHHFTHIPVFDGSDFVGMLPSEFISEFAEDEPVKNLLYDLDFFYIKEHSHWGEVMDFFAKYDTNVAVVISQQGQGVGYYQLSDFVHLLSQTPFFKETGSFVVLETDQQSYSFSQISQIVESHNAKMLGIFISDICQGKVQIALKIISYSLTEILQTFRRYGYAILLEKEDDLYWQELKEKSNYFEKYISF